HLKLNEKEPLILKRNEAYIGVLIDDLITKGTEEPYRMFTSRAEYRILLRQDNADERLTPLSHQLGLASENRLKRVEEKYEKANKIVHYFESQSILPDEINEAIQAGNGSPITQSVKMVSVITRPEIFMKDLRNVDRVRDFISINELDEEEIEQAEIQLKYRGYIQKEKDNADKLKRLENLKIPKDFDYSQLKSISTEARQKFEKLRPDTIAQASRISGVSPSDISILLVYMGR